MNPLVSRHSLRVGAGIAFAALLLVAPGSTAQTPETGATPMAATGDGPHPAHIHTGTCAELGEVVAPLTEVADPVAGGERTGATTAHAVKISQTVIDMPLQEIIDGGHAINVHQSAEAIDVYIACGDIGGVVTTDEGGEMELNIALGELNDSGHVGTAWLGADGEQTEVVITLIEPDAMQ